MKRSGTRAMGLVRIGIYGSWLIVAASAWAEPIDYAGHKLVRVMVNAEADLETLERIGANIWNCHVGIGPIDASLAPDRLDELDQTRLTYAVLDDDIGPETSRHLSGPRGAGPFDDYMPFDQIVTFINNLAEARPDLCEVIDIGNSLEGRDILVLHITGAGAGPKPAVFYHGLQHAREWITGPTVLYLADHLVNNYDSDPCVADLVDDLDIYLAPCVNPDGYVYTWTNNRLWRKNRRNNGGSFGVDLNRNWGYQWNYSESGSSSSPTSETYRGIAAFSEPETTALSNFVMAHPNIRAYMDYHSYSELILWPWGYDCFDVPEPDASTFAALGIEMQRLIADVHGHTYTAGPVCQTLYDANGSSVDWMYGAAGRFGFTIELRPTGNPGFELPPDQIIPTCEENLPAILHLTHAAADGLTLSFPNGLPAQTSPGQPTTLDLDIAELFDTYASGSGAVNYRFASTAPFSSAALTPLGGGSYTASIPRAPCGATIEYYVTAQAAGGGTAESPCDAPSSVYTATVAGVTVAFADSFAADLGWAAANLGATSGQWQRGMPVNDPNWAYDPASDSDGNGWCFLTQNAAGNTDVDTGAVQLTSPTLDMSAGDLTISYDYYLFLTVVDGGDHLRVEINSNNGAGAWTQIADHQSNGGLDWRHHEITPATLAGAGVTPTATMKVRFTANDGGAPSIVEAGLDAFKLVRCDAAPGDADGDGDADLADYAYFVDCLGGANAPPPPTCASPHEVFDFNADNDIDFEDFAGFQAASAP